VSKPSPKLDLYAAFATVAKAAGHARRLDLLEHVAQGERSVETLAGVSGLSVANASHHLLQLRRGGLVNSRRDGKRVLYRLSSPEVLDLLAALRSIAERHVAEAARTIKDYFLARDDMEPMSISQLRGAVKRNEVLLLDVRPVAEFEMGHVRGARNIPLKDLERQLRSLPRSREIVAYCRGPYCVLSFEAVALLRQRGYKVRRLDGGLPECAAARIPVDRASLRSGHSRANP
jgi:rhodanese-related sulfurtransferase/DNA-binding transcriptional ArsR family regulator